jgi:IS30 family transposase
MGYQRLALADRYQIYVLKKSGNGVREIARLLGRTASTISRELKNNSRWLGYEPGLAHRLSKQRAKEKPIQTPKIRGELEDYVRQKVGMDWSPEQISGRLKKERQAQVSYSTLYRFIYRDARKGGVLWQHLRTQRKKRKNRKKSILAANFRALKEVRSISKRPQIVEKKKRRGDLERDLICGTKPGAVILTINDRVTRSVKIGWLPTKCSRAVHQMTVRLLKNQQVRTLTNDNGTEFARHQQTERALKSKVYFSHKGCAWERGANENTNGLLRQYFPRSMQFSEITQEQIQNAERRLNSRPRKCLGYRTPYEVDRQLGQVLR